MTAIAGPWNEWYLKEPELSIDPIPEPELHIEYPPEGIDGGKPDWAPNWNDTEEGEITVGGWPDEKPEVKEPEEEVVLEPQGVEGDYVIDGYDNNKNDWHYVSIKKNRLGGYRWTNRAGVEWTLTERMDDPDHLDVGTDCPYYESGHTVAELRRDA